MANAAAYPPLASRKLIFSIQIMLRIIAIIGSAVAAFLMITNNDTEIVYGIQADARYSYDSSFRFFVLGNFMAVGVTILSLLLILVLACKPIQPNCYFFIFFLDLVMGYVLVAGCAAATAIGLLGKYGNEHTGWMAICNNFDKFCSRTTNAIATSYLSVICYVILILVTANESRN